MINVDETPEGPPTVLGPTTDDQQQPLMPTPFQQEMQSLRAEQRRRHEQQLAANNATATSNAAQAQPAPPAVDANAGSRGGLPAATQPDDYPHFEEAHIKDPRRSPTKLPDGRSSMLLDLGSRINLIGSNTERDFSKRSEPFGHKTIFTPRPRLNVTGVGSDATPCDHKATIPVAVDKVDEPTSLDTFEANVATGCGSNLPAIWGLDSMQDLDAVICLRRGKETIAFPGPGGYKIDWSPGTKRLKVTPAPSGHLAIPCDKFDQVSKDNRRTDHITFITDHTNPVATTTDTTPAE